MAIDPADLRKWGSRGPRRASVTSPPLPAPAASAAPPANSLPAPPAGYQYVIHQGVPMLAPIAGYGQGGPGAAPAAPRQAFVPGANVIPIGSRKSRGARLVRPLSKDGVVVPDPYDLMMDGLPDLAADPGMSRYVEALVPQAEEALGAPVAAPENPFGRTPLSLGTKDLPNK